MEFLQNLINLTPQVLIVVIIVILLAPLIVLFIIKNFEISEITPASPWIKLTRKSKALSKIVHNLPQPDYARFIGREKELIKIEELLRPYPKSRYHIITLGGVGGVGKSSLALEIAHRQLRNEHRAKSGEKFQAIIWVSAKRSILTEHGIVNRKQAVRTLDDIFNTIVVVCEQSYKDKEQIPDLSEYVRKILTSFRTLLVIDNLETIEDEAVISFIKDLPAPSKAIITTRKRIDAAYSIMLTGMDLPDAEILIKEDCEKRSLLLNSQVIQNIYMRTGGIPLAMVWSIAKIGSGVSPDNVLKLLGQPTGDVAQFIFKSVISDIRKKPSYKLLMALSLAGDDPSSGRLGFLTDLSELDIEEGLSELEQYSLIYREGQFYKMLPLTTEYVRGELGKNAEIREILVARTTVVTYSEIAPLKDQLNSKNSTYELRTVIGISSSGEPFEFQLSDKYVHSLIVGMSGSGKTNMMYVITQSFASWYSPDEISFYFISEKDEFRPFGLLPHTLGTASNDESYESIFNKLIKERDQRRELFLNANASDFKDFREKSPDKKLPRIVIFVDELLQFQKSRFDKPYFNQLDDLLRISRTYGFHFVMSTQTPSHISEGIINNIQGRFVFRCVHEEARLLLRDNYRKALGLNTGEAIFDDLTSNIQLRTALFRETHRMG